MGRAAVTSGANAETDVDGGVQLVSVSWNQDSTHFGAVTTADFRVFDCSSPVFHEKLRRGLPHGAGADRYAMVGVEMLFRSEIFALVFASGDGEGGGGRSRVVLWDDRQNRPISNLLDFKSDVVRAVRMSKDYLVVVLDGAVRVYQLCTMARPIRRIPTALNRRGLCCLSCLSCHVDVDVLACLGTERGQVRVERLGEKPETRFIEAHSSHVACIAMAIDGAVLATASVKGTLIRVFSTMDGACLQQVRRGLDPAEIQSIALSRDLQWLAVCSDKGTLHVFSLRIRVGAKDAVGHKQYTDQAAARSVVKTNTASNARSSLSFMKVILPGYFSSEWSFAQYRLPETTTYVTAFGEQQNTVMIIGMDGCFYRCSFDLINGGKEMVRKEYFRFLKDKDSPPFKAKV